MTQMKMFLILFLVLAAAAACTTAPTTPTVQASPTNGPSSTATSLPTDTPIPPTFTPTDTLTPVPSLTPTSTITLTPSQTPTPTRTPTRTIAFNLPGLHQVNRCGRTSFHYSDSRQLDFNGPYTLTVDLCVTTVLVNRDGTMKFNLEWHLIKWDGTLPSRYMYASNDYLSLGDNLNNGYGRIGDSGIVVDNDVMGGKPDTYICWYLFPPPQDGATTFILYDGVKKVSVTGIMLWPGK